MGTKIGSFISSIISFLFVGVGTYTCYNLGNSINNATGIETLGSIATFPLLIIMYIVTFVACISCLFTSAKTISSNIVVIKVLGIILLLGSIIALVLNIITCINVF